MPPGHFESRVALSCSDLDLLFLYLYSISSFSLDLWTFHLRIVTLEAGHTFLFATIQSSSVVRISYTILYIPSLWPTFSGTARMASHSEVGRTQLASFDNYQLTIPKLESQQPPLAISIPQLPSLSTLRSPLTTTSGNRLYGASSICDIFASTKEHRRSQPRRISALYPPPAPRSILASHGSLNDRRQRRDYVRRSRDESDRRRLKEQIYKNPAFQDYRRNAGKPGTSSKDGPRWPDWMESDFWDGTAHILD